MKIGLAIVAAAIIIAGGTLILLPYFLPPPPDTSRSITVIDGDVEVNFTLNQLALMNPLQGNSSYQNQYMNWGGTGTYIGPRLSTLLESANIIIGENDTVKVSASDGFAQYYAYYNVYPNTSIHNIQGDLILAYSYNGTTPDSSPNPWQDGPRTVFLPSDLGYSVDDANQTTHPAWFFGSGGGRWVRNVVKIEVLRDTYFGGLNYIRLINGEEEERVYWLELALMDNLQGVSVYQNKFGNWRDYGTYIGPLLSDIVEIIGTIDQNDVVRVNASDGYSVSYAYYNLYPNTSIYNIQGDLILAYSFNGTKIPDWADGPRTAFLPSDEAYNNTDAELTTHPSWFFGSAGARWTRNVITIEILSDTYPPTSRTITPTELKPPISYSAIEATFSDLYMGKSSHLLTIDVVPTLKLREVP
ncbi:MAG: hypothetical protein ACFFCO_00220 [Promethearchaeota archaeon]